MSADVLTATELAALANQRSDALAFCEELEGVAICLRQVAYGEATTVDLDEVRFNINGAGELVVRVTLDWPLLLRHGRRPTELDALRDAEAARVLGVEGEAS